MLNLAILPTAQVKLLDFGVSSLGEAPPKNSGVEQRRHSQQTWLMKATGTPAFFAPEMCLKGGYLGPPADVWAAGVTLCMMTGSTPFAAEHTPAVFERIQRDEPDLPPHASDALAALLHRMLCKNVRQRATLTELRDDQWVTDSGRFPMPPNLNLVEVSAEDLANAITSMQLDTTLTVIKAKNKLKAMLNDAKKRDRDSDAGVNAK